jgi:hypothetical protein
MPNYKAEEETPKPFVTIAVFNIEQAPRIATAYSVALSFISCCHQVKAAVEIFPERKRVYEFT